MKHQTIIILFFVALFISCTRENDNPIGKWDDNILLSTKKIVFSANSDSATITTSGSGWWLIGVRADGIEFYDFSEINTLSDSYTVKRDSLTFNRIDKNTIMIQVSENPKSTERQFYIDLQNGNYFGSINVIQKAK